MPIVAAVATAPFAPGGMTLADLAGYTAKERQPVCADYRGDRICGVGPPSSGGHTVAQTMKLIERFDLGGKSGAALQPWALHLIAEAEKLAFADRNRYLAYPDFVTIPDGLLDPGEPNLALAKKYGVAKREMPGDGVLPLREIFDAMPDDIDISIEVIKDRDPSISPTAWAKEGLDKTKAFFGDA